MEGRNLPSLYENDGVNPGKHSLCPVPDQSFGTKVARNSNLDFITHEFCVPTVVLLCLIGGLFKRNAQSFVEAKECVGFMQIARGSEIRFWLYKLKGLGWDGASGGQVGRRP